MIERHTHNAPLPGDRAPAPGPELCFPVSELGCHAAAALSHVIRWSVLAVFRRTFYCVGSDDTVFCVGGCDIGRSPLSILCVVSQTIDWREDNVRAGACAKFIGRSLILDGGLIFPFLRARVWNPPVLSSGVTPRMVARGLSALATEAHYRAPREGFAPLIPLLCRLPAALLPPESSTPLSRAASRAIIALGTWLREGPFGVGANIPAPPSDLGDLIGLGPGLTPSGDDFLGGVMIALHALDAGSAAQALADRILPLARRNTPLISYAHLRCAADGAGAESLHRTILGVADSSARILREGLDGLARFGKTSGWDALAGAVLVLGCFAALGWDRSRAWAGARSSISCRDEL